MLRSTRARARQGAIGCPCCADVRKVAQRTLRTRENRAWQREVVRGDV